MPESQLQITGREVRLKTGRRTLGTLPLEDFLQTAARAAPIGAGPVLPQGVRMFVQRNREVVGVVAEMPPQPRTVRWLADDSAVPFGPRARYRDCFLAFPYVILVLVLAEGRPTGLQQLFYRTAPLETPDDELLFSNMPNVAKAYGQTSWLCLQHLKLPGQASLLHTLPAVMNHVYSAAFNRSADVHEGNSYWQSMRDVDTRVASLEAWEAATREHRYFAVEVPWRSAGTTAAGELRAMLEHADASLPAEPTANDLAGLFIRARSGRQRR